MRTLLLIIGVLLAAPIIFCAGTELYARHVNNVKLDELARRYGTVKHPPGSRSVAFESELGLYGNGNHCDFFVGELRATTAPREETDRAYPSEGQPCWLETNLDTVGEGSSMAPYQRLFKTQASLTPGEWVYLVWCFDQTEAGADFRCH